MRKFERKNVYRIYAALLVALALVAAVAFNSVSGFLTDRFDWRFDMTQGQIYELSEQTIELLGANEGAIEVYTLFRTGHESRSILNLLDKMAAVTPRLYAENIDPVKNPVFTEQFDPGRTGVAENSLIVTNESRSRYKIIAPGEFYTVDPKSGSVTGFLAEQKIATAISYVDTGRQNRVLFLQGHGEAGTADMPVVIAALTSSGYTVGDHSLTLGASALDAQNDALLMVAPKSDITDAEYDALKAFLNEGGRFMLCAAPTNAAFTNLSELLSVYGCALGEGVVVEQNTSNYINEQTTLVPRMTGMDVTSALIANSLAVVFPYARPVLPLSSSQSGATASTPVLVTTDNSYAAALDSANNEKNANALSGPLTVGLAAVGSIGEDNFNYVLVYGGAQWLTDATYFQNAGNYNLMLTSLAWLYSGETSLNIAPKVIGADVLVVPSGALRTGMAVMLVAVMPLLLIAAGVVTLVQRRSK